jgi:hypothetical protein
MPPSATLDRVAVKDVLAGRDRMFGRCRTLIHRHGKPAQAPVLGVGVSGLPRVLDCQLCCVLCTGSRTTNEVHVARQEPSACESRAIPKDLKGLSGIHVRVPLEQPSQTKELARRIAEALAERHPDEAVAEMNRERRVGKVYVDWLQNDPSRQTVAPYSLRECRGRRSWHR